MESEETVAAVMERAREGSVTVFDLGRPMFPGMPQSPNHPTFQMTLQRRHGDVMRADGSSAANEIIVTGAHVGTHIDALCHASYQGLLHGGLEATGLQSALGFSQLGVETIDPMVCRGILLDIPAALGSECCPPAYEVLPEDLDTALALTGTVPRNGDVLLVRSGWGQRFSDRETYIGRETGVPGVGERGARWLSAHHPRAVGADTIAFECIAPGAGHALLPAHRHLLVESGIYLVEALELEALSAAAAYVFTFVLSPLKLVGATGSPVRPLAVINSGHGE